MTNRRSPARIVLEGHRALQAFPGYPVQTIVRFLVQLLKPLDVAALGEEKPAACEHHVNLSLVPAREEFGDSHPYVKELGHGTGRRRVILVDERGLRPRKRAGR